MRDSAERSSVPLVKGSFQGWQLSSISALPFLCTEDAPMPPTCPQAELQVFTGWFGCRGEDCALRARTNHICSLCQGHSGLCANRKCCQDSGRVVCGFGPTEPKWVPAGSHGVALGSSPKKELTLSWEDAVSSGHPGINAQLMTECGACSRAGPCSPAQNSSNGHSLLWNSPLGCPKHGLPAHQVDDLAAQS